MANSSKLVVEPGHLYENRQPSELELIGVSLAMYIIDSLVINPTTMLFVDDLVEKPIQGSVETMLEQCLQLGYKVDELVYESSLVAKGIEGVNLLLQSGRAKSDRNSVFLKKPWIPLMGKAGVAEIPSCPMLDAVLYQQKLRNHGGAVTLLPHTDQNIRQQASTKAILDALVGKTQHNVAVIFYNNKAEVTHCSDWRTQ